MKRIIFLLAITIGLLNNANAQHWALPSSEWSIVTIYGSPYSPPTTSTYKVTGDTIIGGKTCKHISNMFTSVYSYEENDTVFFYENGNFYPTLYFSAEQGDTVDFPVLGEGYCPDETTVPHINCVIDSVNSITIGGKVATRFYFSQLPAQSYDYLPETGYYTEFLGAGNLYPYFVCLNVTDWDSYVLCSYYDSTMTSTYFARTCPTSSIKGIDNIQFSISPNPTSDFLTIETAKQEELVAEIYDLSGRKIHSADITNNKIIDVRGLSSSVYQIKLTGKQGSSTKLWVKE